MLDLLRVRICALLLGSVLLIGQIQYKMHDQIPESLFVVNQ